MKNPFKRTGKDQTHTSGVFQIGDAVRVKAGVLYPDEPDIDISGWQGRISDVDGLKGDPPVVGLKWDSVSLRSLPDWLIEKSEEEGSDWVEMYLYTSELEHAPPRDTEAAADKVRAELSANYGWSFLGEEGRRINAVLRGVTPGDQVAQFAAWGRYFQKTLKFPFEAEVAEFMVRGRLRVGDIVTVLRIELVDDDYGVIVRCRRGREQIDAPLADLECTDIESANHDPVKDYAVWFANR